MVVIIDDSGDDESPKSGGREVFVGGGDRRDNRFVSWSVVVVEGLVSGQRRRGLNPSYERLGLGGGAAYSGGGGDGDGGEKGSWRKL